MLCRFHPMSITFLCCKPIPLTINFKLSVLRGLQELQKGVVLTALPEG